MVSGATLTCDQGDQQSELRVSSDRQVEIDGKAQATVVDSMPNKNIMPFGKCKSMRNPTVAAATAANQGRLKPMPCVPAVIPPWKGGKNDVQIKGAAVLIESSFIFCQWGGQIKVEKTGQATEFETDGAVAAKLENVD